MMLALTVFALLTTLPVTVVAAHEPDCSAETLKWKFAM
jgi:hypothetical protein